jgi:uncharacterized repeat protein (TIGR02543 family)
MKKTGLLSAFIALALVVSFSGCPNPTESKPEPGTLTATLKYNANGGKGTVPETQTVNQGTVLIIANKGDLTYSGKHFSGWNTKADGKNGIKYAPGDSLDMDQNYTLYAQWADIDIVYTVSYDANGGTGTVPEPQTADTGSSVILADGDTLTRNGYHFGGWNTSRAGTGTNYKAGSSLMVTANRTLYAQWIAPLIRTGDTYKEVTSDGVVRIHLTSGTQYIFEGTEEYRLYRSSTRSDGYSVVATVPSTQLILEDTTANWMTVGDSYYYKVAAVSGGIEAMSTNGARINMVTPKVYQRSYTSGSFGIALLIDGTTNDGYQWPPTQSAGGTTYQLLLSPELGSFPPPNNYILFTSTSTSTPATWTNYGMLIIRASHTYTINPILGTTDRSFEKSNWTFFTP